MEIPVLDLTQPPTPNVERSVVEAAERSLTRLYGELRTVARRDNASFDFYAEDLFKVILKLREALET